MPSRTHLQLRRNIRAGSPIPMGVSVIVPVYRELNNGNIFRLLSSFSRQTADRRHFRLVFIVNNTPERATARDAVFCENQQTLRILQFLASPRADRAVLREIEGWQAKILVEAKQAGLQITLIDATTAGIPRNIGMIRNRAWEVVAQGLDLNREDHLVAMMDADTLVPPRYIENIISHFLLSGYNSLFLFRKTRPLEGAADARLWQTTAKESLNLAEKILESTLNSSKMIRSIGSPQIVTRASVLASIGGIPQRESGEDTELANRLARVGKVGFAEDVVTVSSDRARADSYEGACRSTGLDRPNDMKGERCVLDCSAMLNYCWNLLFPAADYFRLDDVVIKSAGLFDKLMVGFDRNKFEVLLLESLQSEDDRSDKTLSRLKRGGFSRQYFPGVLVYKAIKEYCGQNTIMMDEAAIAIGIFGDNSAEAYFIRSAILREQILHDRAVEARLLLVRAALNNWLGGLPITAGITDGLALRFYAQNRWIDGYVDDLLSGAMCLHTVESAIELVKADFPEWLNIFQSAPLSKEAAVLFATAEVCCRASRQPGSFADLISGKA